MIERAVATSMAPSMIRSSSVTRPTGLPPFSISGTRRQPCSRITRTASSTPAVTGRHATSSVITSCTATSRARSRATTSMARSRSVTIPTSCPCSATRIEPMWLSAIARAAACALARGERTTILARR
jgi:hypothetical protein